MGPEAVGAGRRARHVSLLGHGRTSAHAVLLTKSPSHASVGFILGRSLLLSRLGRKSRDTGDTSPPSFALCGANDCT